MGTTIHKAVTFATATQKTSWNVQGLMSGEWQPEERENYPGGYDWSKRCVLSPERNLARVMDRRGPGDELVMVSDEGLRR